MSQNQQKFEPPEGPPPSYPQPVHQDAGPYNSPGSPFQGDPRGNNGNYYGSPVPQNEGYGSPTPQGYYGPPAQYNGGGQGGFGYGGPQQQGPMQYQQQGYGGGYGGPGYAPQGYYANQRGGPGGAGEGICAGLLAAMACCCCLDILI